MFLYNIYFSWQIFVNKELELLTSIIHLLQQFVWSIIAWKNCVYFKSLYVYIYIYICICICSVCVCGRVCTHVCM